MTRVVADRIEQQEDGLRFGDPIGCHYHWLDPGRIDAYGDQVRRLASRVELAVDGFDRTASISEDVFAGEAADALRDRAGRRSEESAEVRHHLLGLGRAIHAYADVLRVFGEGLEQLRAFAVGRGLDVHDHRVWPPVRTLSGDATQREAHAWEADWTAYRECFELTVALRDARRSGARELVRALAEHADVHPDRDGAHQVAAHHGSVAFGGLRRDAAEEAIEAVDAHHRAEQARHTVEALRRRERAALDSLEEMVLAERPPGEIAGQAARVQVLHHELGDARAEAREADAVAQREQVQAHRAARVLADAEAGRPHLVAPLADQPLDVGGPGGGRPQPDGEPLDVGGADDGRPVAQPIELHGRLG